MKVLVDGRENKETPACSGATKGFLGGRDSSLPIATRIKGSVSVFSVEKQSALLHLVVLPEFLVSLGLLPDTLGLCYQQIFHLGWGLV